MVFIKLYEIAHILVRKRLKSSPALRLLAQALHGLTIILINKGAHK